MSFKSYKDPEVKKALYFVLLLGLVSLFSDMTYEAARSITGPYLLYLGASASAVGFAVGFGEFVGYALRLISGYLADRTKRYWFFTILGYGINLLAVPALALASTWQIALMFIILERFGKALRVPVRDTFLSYATTKIGRGIGFGLHEALDQVGALVGPLIVFLVFYRGFGYKEAFSVLLAPALLALTFLFIARLLFAVPAKFEADTKPAQVLEQRLPRDFWLYAFGMGFLAFGFLDFALISFHWEKVRIFEKNVIPLLYALAMGVDAISALILGYLYDRIKLKVLLLAIFLSLWAIPLSILGDKHLVILGVILWGIGLSAQESIIRATIAELVPKERRGTAYGVFNALFGGFWFLGSFSLGFLYDFSPLFMVICSVAFQALAIPFVIKVKVLK
jgi:MFS family permease